VLNWKLHCLFPAGIDKPLHDGAAERKSRIQYRAVYNHSPLNSISFICLLFLRPLAIFTVSLWEFYFGRLIGKPTSFLQLQKLRLRKYHQDFFRFRHHVVYSLLKYEVGNVLAKDRALRINLNTDGAPTASYTHTHPSHSQSSRLLSPSLSLGI